MDKKIDENLDKIEAFYKYLTTLKLDDPKILGFLTEINNAYNGVVKDYGGRIALWWKQEWEEKIVELCEKVYKHQKEEEEIKPEATERILNGGIIPQSKYPAMLSSKECVFPIQKMPDSFNKKYADYFKELFLKSRKYESDSITKNADGFYEKDGVRIKFLGYKFNFSDDFIKRRNETIKEIKEMREFHNA